MYTQVIFFNFFLLFFQTSFVTTPKSKQNKIEQNQKESAKAFALDGLSGEEIRCEWNEKLLIKNRDGICVFVSYLILLTVT